jgi:hypothetical protein
METKIANPSRQAELIRVVVLIFMFPLPPRGAALKERVVGLIAVVGHCGLPVLTPTGSMLDDPIRQRLLKTDVTPGLFGFDPLVFEDFFPFRLKFTVQGRVFQQIIRRR